MKYFVYVLRDKNGKLYKGMTNNPKRRIKEHLNKHTQTTAKMIKPEFAYIEEFDNFIDARKRELYFKTAAGRRFIKKKIGPMV